VTEARAHHFVPQCYLNNFAPGKKITVVDLKSGKAPFSTNPKNVAQERDFNRIDSDTLAPDALENAYAQFEGELAPVLKKLVAGETCTEDDFCYVLSLMGVLGLRNPRFRGSFAEFQNSVRQKMVAVALSTKERWEKQLARMREDGYLDGKPDVPYEELKAQLAEGNIRFVTSTSEHARTELYAVDDLINILARRSWRWVRAAPTSGGFISCDHPVCLNWIKRPRGFAPIGYGLNGTTVYFPLSPALALLGEFNGRTDDVAADIFMVGDFNRRVLNNAHRQIYAADKNFRVFDGVALFGIDELVQLARGRQEEDAE
jgi:hypothetical protein